MSEPLEMSKARNAYGKERDRFRRELQWAMRQYEDRPLNFEIKQNLRFLAASLKEDCMNAYRHATKSIISNQDPLVGNSLRLQVMANSEDAASSLRRSRSPTSYRSATGARATRTVEDDDDIDAWISRNRASGVTGRIWGVSTGGGGGPPSVPLTKMTYGAHKSASTNTHVLSFERQLKADIEQMIDSIDYLDDKNRANWLTIPKSDRTQYFTSKYDDTSYSVHSITTPTRPLFDTKSTESSSTTTAETHSSALSVDANSNGLAPSEARSYFDHYLKKY